MLILQCAVAVIPDVSEIHIYSKAGLNFMVSDIGYVPEIQAYDDTLLQLFTLIAVCRDEEEP
jgi:hypothetical protein